MTCGWKATIAGILMFSCGLPSMGIAEVGDGAFTDGDVVIDEICMDSQGIASAGATFEGGEVRKIALKRID